jgi:hypothetical protein
LVFEQPASGQSETSGLSLKDLSGPECRHRQLSPASLAFLSEERNTRNRKRTGSIIPYRDLGVAEIANRAAYL